MTTDLVNHVDATFGGEKVRFDIRNELASLEYSLGGGAYALMRRIMRSEWTTRELVLVLSAGVPDEFSEISPDSTEATTRRLTRALTGVLTHPPEVIVSPFVARVLHEGLPARYAVLVQRVLEAALFGIPEEQATFDESEMM